LGAIGLGRRPICIFELAVSEISRDRDVVSIRVKHAVSTDSVYILYKNPRHQFDMMMVWVQACVILSILEGGKPYEILNFNDFNRSSQFIIRFSGAG
jgi:hypothetical protein